VTFFGRAARTSPDADEEDEDSAEWQCDKPVALFEQRGGKCVVRRLVGSGQLRDPKLVFEVLPKVSAQDGNPHESRQGLRRMWSFAADLQSRSDKETAQVGVADEMPLHEWLVRRFIGQVEDLLRRGIRRQYVEHEDNLNTARGRLLPLQNLRQNAFAPHRFYCRFEELSADRPENRLIRSALAELVRGSADAGNRRRAAALADWLHEVPVSRDVTRDFAQWRNDRLMKDYREIRSTCEWILLRQGISPVMGTGAMVGCFARMNDVFERYVARWMAQECRKHDPTVEILDQTREAASGERVKGLWRWKGENSSKVMKPDMVALKRQSAGTSRSCLAVLDAKWKRRGPRDSIPRSDVYQMHAYLRYWLQESEAPDGVIALVYPSTGDDVARRFEFDEITNVQCRVLPFLLPISADGTWKEGLGKV
jgi:5-methylcytosine-specific restriction enzyme subunit McrC